MSREAPVRKNFILQKSSQVLEEVAQDGGAVAIPGGVQKSCRCSTDGLVLVGMVGMGWTLKVFSYLNDSMIAMHY